MLPPVDEIIENFESLDDWEDRYRYVIELGRMMEPLPDASRTEGNRVSGCASQVWLASNVEHAPEKPILRWRGDSDAHIVRGLVALMLALHSGRSPREVLETDAQAVLRRIGLADHLTPQRSNGLRSMVERMRADARAALAV